MPLERKDAKHLQRAQRLVDDGKYLEANEELERIDPWCRHMPEVLTVRLDIYQALEKWDAMETVARRLVRYDPDDVRSTVLWATATRRSDCLAAAQVILLEAVERLADAAALHYKLAAYEAQLGEIETAKARLKHAFKLEPALRRTALDDEDMRADLGFGGSPINRYGLKKGSKRISIFVESEPRATERLKVLVVEDELNVRTLIAAYLKKLHDVETAANGEQGLELFKAGSWDVVLCDGKLGDMNGMDLARAIKAIRPATPIILVTGSEYSLPKLPEGQSPFAARLEKPFGREALQSAITAACGR